jgi:hypothetical protein
VTEPTWHTLPDYLIERFPHLKSAIEQSYGSWLDAFANPYPHVFLEEFLIPLLIGTDTDAGERLRSEAGQVLDVLLVSRDEDLASAALTSVIEMLRDEPQLRSDAWPFLGPTAREWLQRLVK